MSLRVRTGTTRLLLLGAALALAACGARSHPPAVVTEAGGAGAGAPIRIGGDGPVRSVALEEYVAGCVLAELGTTRADRQAADVARAVQAILCRSYAVAGRNRHDGRGFDLCTTTHCQLYRPAASTGGALARAAADATRGIVLVYDGAPVRAVYHAACGGRTSAAASVWSGPGTPWLVSRPDRGCERYPGWTFAVSLDALSRALAADDRLDVHGPIRRVDVLRRDEGGRAATVRLVGRTTVDVSGDQFRSAVLRAFGAQSLKSTLFTIHRSQSTLTFQGRGSGHGVGLCQAGAVRRAARGESAADILFHYFPGTALARVH